jgi:hypothetical protein
MMSVAARRLGYGSVVEVWTSRTGEWKFNVDDGKVGR